MIQIAREHLDELTPFVPESWSGTDVLEDVGTRFDANATWEEIFEFYSSEAKRGLVRN